MEPNLKFKELRKGLKLSQIEFAKKTGVSQGTITDIERGRIGVSKSMRRKIKDTFGVESGYFDTVLQVKNTVLNQGAEPGLNQGKRPLKATLKHWEQSKLDPIVPYLDLNESDLKVEISLEIENLKVDYNNYKKLLDTIYKLDPPAFFAKKFQPVKDFEEYMKLIENDYQPNYDQDGNENSFTLIDKIIELYKSEQEHCKHKTTILIDYFNRYVDYFSYSKGIKDALDDMKPA
jgi:DNA-binding XRE family transcriptional regulator